MRERSRLHGILGLIQDRGYYKWQQYIKGVRPRPITICRINDALFTSSGRRRTQDQITGYLERLIDEKKYEVDNEQDITRISEISNQWLANIKKTMDSRTFYLYRQSINFFMDANPDFRMAD